MWLAGLIAVRSGRTRSLSAARSGSAVSPVLVAAAESSLRQAQGYERMGRTVVGAPYSRRR
jgi:hypothetical protein